MSLSQIAQMIGESATLKLNETATTLRDQGEQVIHLGGGEPKSSPPDCALEAAHEKLNRGDIRYGPASGIPDLKKAVVAYTSKYYQHDVTPKHVIASSGAKQALMISLQALVDPGDEVVYPAPYWVSYPEMVRICGGVGVPATPADGSFYPTLADIERCTSPRTKAVLINSPNNPSGAMYSEAFVADIVGFCESRGLYLIMDDIYHRLIFDGREPISCYRFARQQDDDSKIVVINGVSKQYAMTGFRIGWAVASPTLIKAMTKLQAHQTSGPAMVMQHAAIGAIHGDQADVASLRATLEHNREVLMECLDTISGVKVSKPDGTFYAFVDFSAFGKGATELSAFLLEKVRVVTVPGDDFGTKGHLRISTCGSAEEIKEGVARIRWALDPSAPDELIIGDRRLVRDWM